MDTTRHRHGWIWLDIGLSRLSSVEQGALMSPNPRGMPEDLAAGCVCLKVFEFFNPLFIMM